MTTIAVVTAGLREPSSTRLLADRLAEAVRKDLPAGSVELPMIDLRLYGKALMDATLTGFISPELQAAFDTLTSADGLIAVTPAFNASYSGLFKLFFDVLPLPSLDGMPVLIAATGGTERHSLVLEHSLRPMFSYLHAIVAPTAVYAATGDFGGDGNSGLSSRIDRAAEGFVRLLTACGPRSAPAPSGGDELDQMRALLGGIPKGNNPN
ncbi:NADPH-dependent FMN reductase [Flexivirga sp. ID2601S]|uniref:NADPH-dependent FMN reductase n=1 Tax=Flexivirga aerilata TaxID=1656889 RepID=A0A849ABK5_9MICO|nr:CE1759 family FMN reductase [Flexivirga aerilata]NNG37869.1 NADPH-dependent FMN reductase [Flexivirga aerilata]